MKIVRRSLRVVLFLFLLLNIVAAFHAYRFTHFYEGVEYKIMKPESMSWFDKLGFIFLGMKYPKSKNRSVPAIPYETIALHTKDKLKLEGWFCKNNSSVGSVVLFHGHGASKSSVIAEAQYFYALGYNTFCIDFRAHGNSDGTTCTIGYDEAEDVKLAWDFLKSKGEKNIVLWGRSLGAATITRAISDYKIRPQKIILEMSFGSLQEAVKGRIRLTRLPEQPLAALLTFWGGVQQGFWAFSHNPCDYAAKIDCPVLVQHASQDTRVSLEETNCIYDNLKTAEKKLVIYETAGHESLYKKEPAKWESSIRDFLMN
ncbi:MAG: alpha/beta fold hydrolase [Chitinophagaceae bacterium]|nr:alpha/beta fold hydrolase [Chitinophagaceae bacterium]